jgi:GTP-binding protein HflX
VRKLPHDLVEAFRSTLEEVTRADLVVHVADAASPELAEQIEAVRTVLGEIGAGHVPEILALNKIDLVTDRSPLSARYPDAVLISAATGEGLELLLERIAERLPRFPVRVELLLPHERGDLRALLHREAEVLSEEVLPEGVLVRARVGERVHALVARYAAPAGVAR